MKIEISQLSKFLKIDHRNELEIWIEKIKVGLQSILLDLDATIIKQDTISRFGIVIYIQSTQYGKCYLKFVPQILERYNNEKKIQSSRYVEIMKEYNVKMCLYGHLHGQAQEDAFEGLYDGIYFKLISADYLNFKLYQPRINQEGRPFLVES